MFGSFDKQYLETGFLASVMELAIKIDFAYAEDVLSDGDYIGKQYSVKLNSSIIEGVFYELLMCDVESLETYEFYIIVGTEKKKEGKNGEVITQYERNFYLYGKDRILVWNECTVELCEALPALKKRLLNSYTRKVIKARTDRKFLPKLCREWDVEKINDFNEFLMSKNLMSVDLRLELSKAGEV